VVAAVGEVLMSLDRLTDLAGWLRSQTPTDDEGDEP